MPKIFLAAFCNGRCLRKEFQWFVLLETVGKKYIATLIKTLIRVYYYFVAFHICMQLLAVVLKFTPPPSYQWFNAL